MKKFKTFHLICTECVIPCYSCIVGTPTAVRPWFRGNCPRCKGTGLVPFENTIETNRLKDKDKICPKCKREMKVVL